MLTVDKMDLYYGASHALRNVTLRANAGSVTCVLGRNGVGKTSLLRAIMGLHPVATGSIKWKEEEITSLSPYERARRKIAFVPQGREIFPLLTVEENLLTGYAALPKKLQYLPEEIFELFPILRDMLNRKGGDLSGGQQQQLAIARALVTRPELLLLDEPTEGIQPSIIKDIDHVIRHLRSKSDIAILLVEQYFEFAKELADSYFVMDRGSIVLGGDRRNMVESDVRRHLTV